MCEPILFLPAPEAGHILPTVPVARALANMGHDIVYLTSSEMACYLRRQGFRVEQYISNKLPAKSAPVYNVPVPGRDLWRSTWATIGDECGAAFYQRVLSVAESIRPSVVVADRVFRMRPKNVMNDISTEWPVLFLSTSLLRWDEGAGINDRKCIVLCPPALEPKALRIRFTTVTYAEPSVDLQREEEPFDATYLDHRKPLVICTFGSQTSRHPEIAGRIEAILETADSMPHLQFVIAGGYGVDTNALQAKHPGNAVVLPTVPQLTLLRQASAFITHGGLGAIKEAILTGVPMLVWPLIYDQPFNAKRIQSLRLGMRLRTATPNVSEIQTLLGEVMSSPTIRRRVLKYKRHFERAERHPTAAAAIHQYAVQKSSVRSAGKL